MSASFNSRNRRIAKSLVKTNWYKEKISVKPLKSSSPQGDANLAHDDTGDHASTGEADNKSYREGIEKGVRSSQGLKAGNKKKKRRGTDRANLTLGGLKKMEKTAKRKLKRKLNKKLGSLEIPSKQKNKRRGPPPPTKSVLFVDSTAGGILLKRFQEGEIDLGEKTDYKVRMAEMAGTPLSLILTSSNPWAPVTA